MVRLCGVSALNGAGIVNSYRGRMATSRETRDAVVLTLRVRLIEARLPVVTLIVAALGLMSAYEALFLDPPYSIPVTDFGRDLLGARAAQLGVNPYQTIGALASSMPDWTVRPEAEDLWVAHSPLSLALARVWLSMVGPELAEVTAKFVQGISMLVLVTWIWFFGSRSWSRWHGLLIAAATAMTLGFRADGFWLQGASLLALGIVVVFWLERSDRRNTALVLLGVLVAWRPWLAPIALVLPGSDSILKDGARVALTATIVTGLVLPWTGGWVSLAAWMGDALPANLGHYSVYAWNLSLTGPFLPATLASLLYLPTAGLVASQRFRWPREKWPLLGTTAILALSPLVWAQYWLALVAVLLRLAKAQSFQWTLLIILVMAWPLAEHSGMMSKVTSYLGVLLLVVSLSEESIPDGDEQTTRFKDSEVEYES